MTKKKKREDPQWTHMTIKNIQKYLFPLRMIYGYRFIPDGYIEYKY